MNIQVRVTDYNTIKANDDAISVIRFALDLARNQYEANAKTLRAEADGKEGILRLAAQFDRQAADAQAVLDKLPE